LDFAWHTAPAADGWILLGHGRRPDPDQAQLLPRVAIRLEGASGLLCILSAFAFLEVFQLGFLL